MHTRLSGIKSIAIFAVLSIFCLCKKETVQKNVRAAEYFPNSIGDYWEYNVYDSSQLQQQLPGSRNYTVKVSIAGTKKLADNLDATVWKYQYPWGNDTNYVRIVGDTVKIFDIPYSGTVEYLKYPRQIFLLPFENNKRWDGKLLAIDTSHVTPAPKIITQFGVYDSCFQIYRHYLGPNLEFNDNYWFKQNVGMVMIHYNEYNFAPNSIQLWQLKKYYLH